MKFYSYPNKIENDVTMTSTGCIILNGHEIGQWSKDEDFGYNGFIFSRSSEKRWASNKRQLLSRLMWIISSEIHWHN